MNRFVKNVSVFCVLLASLTLSVHLFIPHDHHSADTFINQDENCPASDHESDHHSGLPLHCQVLNDLTSEKSRPLQVAGILKFSFDSSGTLKDAVCLFKESSFISLKEFSKPLFDTTLLRSTSLRAPPALT